MVAPFTSTPGANRGTVCSICGAARRDRPRMNTHHNTTHTNEVNTFA